MMVRRSLVFILLTAIGLSACDASGFDVSSSRLLSPPSFYDRYDFRLQDPEGLKDEVILIIARHGCQACEAIETILDECLSRDYPDYNPVVAAPREVADNYYPIEKSYREAIDFYYSQSAAFINSIFLNSDKLYQLDSYPTPTLMYFQKSRSLRAMLIGVGLTEASVAASLRLLIGEE